MVESQIYNRPFGALDITGQPVVIEQFDVTPRIAYRDGRAVSVESFCVFNRTDLGSSTYARTTDGRYTEVHFDPEHGGGFRPVEVDRERLQELDDHNTHTIPLLGVLDRSMDEVKAVLEERGLQAYHVNLAV
jgi:hypothetical protein